MKILITTDCYIPTINGVVISTLNLKNELIKKGHEVRILTLSDTRISYEKQGDIYIGSAGAQRVYPEARLTLARNNRFIKELMNWHPDIIHSQSEFSTFIMARRIANRLQIPIIHTYHTIYEDYTHYFSPVKKWGKTMVSAFTNATLKHAHCVIAPSEKVKVLLTGYGIKSEIKVIPTGIDIEKFNIPVQKSSQERLKQTLGIFNDYKILIAVGRLAKEKNHEELLNFIKQLNRSDVKLVIVGDGPNRTNLEAYAKELGICEQVIFVGMIPHNDIGGYYQIGDVFVSASNSETQGLTYYEALANGIPVICRKDECLANVVENGLNGWQYETFEEFSEQLAAVLDQKNGDLSKNSLESVRSYYSLDAFAQNVEAAYLETVNTFREYRQTQCFASKVTAEKERVRQ